MKGFLAFSLVAIVAVSFSPWFRPHLCRGVCELMSWRSTDTITLKDNYLKKEVVLQWDENGDPHIDASCLSDLYFAQGYTHAQDRLWQMETRRSIARGKLAEKFGKKALTLDVFTRTLGFEGSARRYLDVLYSSDNELEKECVQLLKSYTAGINAGVESLSFLPLEFFLARVEWKEWEELDSLSFGLFMQFGLEFGWKQEATMTALRDIVGDEGLSFLGYGQEKVYSYTVPTAPKNWTFFTEEKEEKEEGKEAGRGKKVVEKVKKVVEKVVGKVRAGGEEEKGVEELVDQIGVTEGGSNAWVVSGEYTETGKPHLANDPHLEATYPNVWYHMYLSSPELKVTGASVPGLPAIMIGHNDFMGWGITVTSSDSCDLFEEKIDKEKRVYEFQGEEMELQKEIISFPVKGTEDHTFTRYSTHHGPIVTDIMPTLVFGEEKKEYSFSASSLKTTGTVEEDSVAATFWAVLKHQFMSLVFEEKGIKGPLRESALGKGPHPLAHASTMGMLVGKNFAKIIKNQPSSFLPSTTYPSLILSAANKTITYCEQQWGKDRGEDGERMGEKWKWGQVHTFRWPHPLANLPVIGGIFDLGTYPYPGSSETPLQAASKYGTHQANAYVASFRHIIDFSNIEKSKFLNPPGQTGHPLHDHAGDMVELYLNGGLLEEKH